LSLSNGVSTYKEIEVTSGFSVINLRQLGSGGHGEVLLGQRSDNGEQVVVKYLREAHLPNERKGFAREIALLMRRLYGFVPLLGWDMKAERPFYVMPYFAGGSLSRFAGRLSEIQMTAIAKGLASALANLHRSGDVHGDVKPDNLLLSGSGTMHLADPLGTGGLFTVLFSGNRGGTPGYCAPEVHAGASVSAASDVYSFGATLLHLLTGQRPKDGLPLAVPANASAKLQEVIVSCCQRNSKLRPTMAEVTRILNGEQWPLILAARQQAETVVNGILFVVALFAGVAVLNRKG
jgi:serine/threonine protein kinase